MEALSEIPSSVHPLMVYSPDSSLWLSHAVSKSNRIEFVNKLQYMFDMISGPILLICGQDKVAIGSTGREISDYDSSKSVSSCETGFYCELESNTVFYVSIAALYAEPEVLIFLNHGYGMDCNVSFTPYGLH
ncbi:hypothetical protein Hdeb2414_s0011g00371571 [Helianthus debilis subsp. tardiflorus]